MTCRAICAGPLVVVSKSVEKVVHHVSRIHAATGAAAQVVRLLREPPPLGAGPAPRPGPGRESGRGSGLPPLPGASSTAPALEFRDISFMYHPAPGGGPGGGGGCTPVLDRVSLAVQRGELLALVGPSGGGKSTLLKIALRLLAPDSGEYFLGGADALSAPVEAVRRRLGWVPQEAVIFAGTVTENVMYGSWQGGC